MVKWSLDLKSSMLYLVAGTRGHQFKLFSRQTAAETFPKCLMTSEKMFLHRNDGTSWVTL